MGLWSSNRSKILINYSIVHFKYKTIKPQMAKGSKTKKNLWSNRMNNCRATRMKTSMALIEVLILSPFLNKIKSTKCIECLIILFQAPIHQINQLYSSSNQIFIHSNRFTGSRKNASWSRTMIFLNSTMISIIMK